MKHEKYCQSLLLVINALKQNGQFAFEWRHKWTIIDQRALILMRFVFSLTELSVRSVMRVKNRDTPNANTMIVQRTKYTILKHIKAQSINWINHLWLVEMFSCSAACLNFHHSRTSFFLLSTALCFFSFRVVSLLSQLVIRRISFSAIIIDTIVFDCVCVCVRIWLYNRNPYLCLSIHQKRFCE